MPKKTTKKKTPKPVTEMQYAEALSKGLSMELTTQQRKDLEDGKKLKLTQAQAKSILDAQGDVTETLLKKHGAVKTPFGRLDRVTKPAQRAGQKKVNPFTKETYITEAKPATHKLRLRTSARFKK